jgi:glucokinase
MQTTAFASFETAAGEAVAAFAIKPLSLIACAAGPVEAQKIQLTNASWSIEANHLATVIGLDQGLLLNDFEAQALSLPILPASWTRPIGPPIETAGGGPHLVIGPGTGLGAALLLEIDGRYAALPSEAGHMDFGPIGEEESAFWPLLEKGPHGRISVETLLSGPGLRRLHRARLAGLEQSAAEIDAATLVARALSNHEGEETRTIQVFWDLAARFAGDLALAFMATSVTFSGGILPRILEFLEPARFRACFENKAPHGARMKSVGTRLIVTDEAVLAGMAAIGAAPDLYAIDYARRAWG